MLTLPSELISLIRGCLSTTSRTMLSLTCKALFLEGRDPRRRSSSVEMEEVFASVSLILYVYRRLPMSYYAGKYAARNANMEALQLLHENGHSMDGAYAAAAKKGHLHVIIWLHSNGYAWNGCILLPAAMGGHLHVLRWLRENGAPLHDQLRRCSAMSGKPEVMEWAASQA